MTRFSNAPTLAALAIASLLIGPIVARADETTACTTLAQAAADGLSRQIAADDQTIKPPQSVTTLSCLNNFFSGAGLNVITNLLNPASLLASVEGQICSAVQSTWQSVIGSAQCGLTATGFNVGGFGGLGSGIMCPRLSFGGGGSSVGSIGTGFGAGQTGQFLSGTGVPPTGYTLPTGTNF